MSSTNSRWPAVERVCHGGPIGTRGEQVADLGPRVRFDVVAGADRQHQPGDAEFATRARVTPLMAVDFPALGALGFSEARA